MTSKRLAVWVIPAGLLIALSTAGPAVAQNRTQPTELEAITVVAPRITYQVRGEGMIAKKSARVNLADLDLSRTTDLYTLEDRVNEAAARVCEELAEEFPDGEPSMAVCTRRAAQDAMAHLRQMTRESAKRP